MIVLPNKVLSGLLFWTFEKKKCIKGTQGLLLIKFCMSSFNLRRLTYFGSQLSGDKMNRK